MVPVHLLEAARRKAQAEDRSLAQVFVRALRQAIEQDRAIPGDEVEVQEIPEGAVPRPLPRRSGETPTEAPKKPGDVF